MWFYVGIALVLWIIYDLMTGKVWSYRLIKRSEEPIMYWLFLSIWLMVALVCMGIYYV